MPTWPVSPPWYFGGAVVLIALGALGIVLRSGRARSRLEERLRFETLLSHLSAGLIHLPAASMDRALEHSLGEVVSVLGGDRGILDEFPGIGQRAHISWTAPGIAASPQLLDTTRFPWTNATLRNDGIVRFSRTDELPAVASRDRTSYEQAGTRSHLSVPLRAGDAVLGVVALDAVNAERAWSDELVQRLRLLSEAFGNALERRRMEVSLGDRLAFEQTLSSISTAFSTVSGVEFGREVRDGLRRIVHVLDVDRAVVFEISRDGAISQVWTIDEDARAEEFPWLVARVQRGEVVALSGIEHLPDEATTDRRAWLAHGLASLIALPLLVGQTVVGGLVVGAARRQQDWERHGRALQIFAEVFANALARTQGEREMRRLRGELAHIGRVSALGELTASLAHELNQPLTAILNNAFVAQSLLEAEVLDLAELRTILTEIVADDERASAVIQRVRLLLKKGDLEYVPLDLNKIVDEVARLVTTDTAARHVAMQIAVTPGLPDVRGDRVQLQQVLLNLVLNGLDAMQASGTGDRALVIRTFRHSDALVGVAVQDSGSGIAAEDADRIFEPLYTTKSEGIGMGLAIARTIVGAHGGRLTARNNADGGATFQFTLPVNGAPAQ